MSDMEVEYTVSILAIDRSGSTDIISYWEKCKEYKARFKSETEGQQRFFLLWNHQCEEVDEKAIDAWIRKKQGTGGTNLQSVCNYILSKHLNKIINLYLVSDGQISTDDVRVCDDLTRRMKLNKVDIVFFSTSSYYRIESLSVAAPFLRESDHVVVIDGETVTRANTKMAIELPDIRTVRQYEEKKEELGQQIANRFGGIGNREMAKQLLELKSRLMKELAAKKSEGFSEEAKDLQDALKLKNYDEAVQLLSSVTQQSDNTGSDIERSILRLVNICINPTKFSYNISDYRAEEVEEVQSTRLERTADASGDEVPDVEEVKAEGTVFECPVMLDVGAPALLVTEVDPLMLDLEKFIIDEIMNCPLNVLQFPAACNRITESLDHPVGVENLRNVLDLGKSPITRRPIVGAFSLCNAKDSVSASTWTLAKVLWGGKLVGSPTLWMCVVYMLISEESRLQYLRENKGFMDAFTGHLAYLLQNYNTSISLSGLPQYPMEKVPVGVALWYVIASGDIYAEQNFDQDRLRHYSRIIPYITKLLNILDYPYHQEYTKHRSDVINVFKYMMARKQEVEKAREVLLSSKYARIVVEEDKFVLTENDVQELPADYPEIYKQLSESELRAIMNLVDPSKKVGKVFIPKVLPSCPVTEMTSSYGYPDDVSCEPQTIVCPATMRPYSTDTNTGENWKLASAQFYRCPVEKQISLYQYYINYVNSEKEFPDKDDKHKDKFLLYIYKKEKKKGRPALPRYILRFIDNCFASYDSSRKCYREITGTEMSPETFVQLTKSAVNVQDRKVIEQNWEKDHPGTLQAVIAVTKARN